MLPVGFRWARCASSVPRPCFREADCFIVQSLQFPTCTPKSHFSPFPHLGVSDPEETVMGRNFWPLRIWASGVAIALAWHRGANWEVPGSASGSARGDALGNRGCLGGAPRGAQGNRVLQRVLLRVPILLNPHIGHPQEHSLEHPRFPRAPSGAPGHPPEHPDFPEHLREHFPEHFQGLPS